MKLLFKDRINLTGKYFINDLFQLLEYYKLNDTTINIKIIDNEIYLENSFIATSEKNNFSIFNVCSGSGNESLTHYVRNNKFENFNTGIECNGLEDEEIQELVDNNNLNI